MIMGLTILIWVAIIILWSLKTASDQRKRRQQARPTNSRRAAERVVPPVEIDAETCDARHARCSAEEEMRRGGMAEETEPVFVEAISLETIAPEPAAVDPLIAAPKEEKAAPSAVVHRPAQPTAPVNPLGEAFDLRRAVIYSEILKPKFEE